MPIIAAYIVPHPPLIIPAVGRGDETRIHKTVIAYQEIARQISILKPSTIILSSPHSVMYADYIHLSPGLKAEGSFSSFGASEIHISTDYDQELVQAIARQANEAGFPAGTLGERSRSLDHATMVPLFFINQFYTGYKLVRVSLSGLSALSHYQFGKLIQKAAHKRRENLVFIASGDLSHKLKDEGPYGYHPEGPRFDKQMVEAMEKADFMRFLTISEEQCEQAAECGHRSFVIMAGTLDGKQVDAKLLSYEGPFGVGYAVASFTARGEDDTRRFDRIYLEQANREVEHQKQSEDPYVRLARKSLEAYVEHHKTIIKPQDLPKEMLTQQAGVFVSLKLDQRLRGCIGTITPTTPSIADEIIQNAISAATRDPRFHPVDITECSRLTISVDVLKPAEPIMSKAELDPKRYGVIVQSEHHHALLLPNLEGIDTIDEQLRVVLRKAGIHEGEIYTMERFEVVRHY